MRGPDVSMQMRGSTAAIAALALALPMLTRAACQVETLELPVKMVGPRATTTVAIGGQSVPLTVDSGAFFSMLTEAAASQLGLNVKRTPGGRIGGVVGNAEAGVTTVPRLQLFKGDLKNVAFIVGGNDPGFGTMGFMGRNILSNTDTEYDLAHGVIRFVFPSDDCARANMAYWAGSSPVGVVELKTDETSRTPAIRVEAKLNGHDVVAVLDTGASTTVVSAQAARRADVPERDWKPAGAIVGVGRGLSQEWTVPFEKFEVGGEAIAHNRLQVADIDLRNADMLLGVDFFLSHRIYVSKQQSKMFFTYNGGPVFDVGQRQPEAKATADAAPTPGDPPASTADELARRGAASASRRDYASALADLNRACELEPTSGALFAQRGAIQRALKQPAKALEDVDRALELDPTLVDARAMRARLRLDAKDRDGAKADLDTLDRTLAPQAQMRLAMSGLYLALEQPAQALAQLNQWLPAHPTEVTRGSALNERCRARLMLGIELDQALDDCTDAVASEPGNSTYLGTRGLAYLRLGKDKDALADFDRSIESRPANASSLYGRGLVRKRLGDAARGDADLAAARKAQADIDARMARIGLVAESPQKP